MIRARKPLALFTGGAPGAGKTTMLAHLLPGLSLVSLDSDDLQDELAAARPQASRASLRPEALRLLERRQDRLVAKGSDIVVNTTAADLGFVEALKRRLEQCGYSTMMVFVRAPLELARRRNLGRPHPVPAEDLDRKHGQATANLPALRALFAERFLDLPNEAGLDVLVARVAPIRACVEALCLGETGPAADGEGAEG